MYDRDTITDRTAPDNSAALFAARWTVGTVAILIIAKAWVYVLSGSAGLLGSLIDSLGDAAISIVTLLAIRLAAKPADEDHRYGHGKAEGLAALFQAGCLAGAAAFLALESFKRLFVPQPIDHHLLGIAVAIFTIAMTLGIVFMQKRALSKADSLALSADQKNYTGDLLMNGGVALALLINYLGGPVWIDTLAGIAIALYIARSAYEIGMEAGDMLMDKELPDEVRLQITRIVDAHEGVYGMHDLRTRRNGAIIHISFDIEVEPEMSLRDAHEITRELEHALLREFPNADIIIHKDPKGDIYDARHRVQGIHH